MSNAYLKAKKENPGMTMREFCQRPGRKFKDGKMMYTTEQGHKKECDINEILKKYDKTGLITHVNRIEAKFGDFTTGQYKTMMDQITDAKEMFQKLPSGIRNRFQNNPGKLLDFMDKPENREEAIKLGLIRADWTPETDGLGEHIKSDDDRKKPTIIDDEENENA